MPVIETMTGNENFPVGSAKLSITHQPSTRFKGKEMHLWNTARANYQEVPVARTQGRKVSAAPGYIDDFGQWLIETWEVPEGIILKLRGERKQAQQTRPTIAQQLVQIRAGAPLQRVALRLTGWNNAAYTRASITGRFDLLTLDEAVQHGAQINPYHHGFFADGPVAECFETSVLDSETQARARVEERQVERGDGEKVTVRSSRRGRAIDV